MQRSHMAVIALTALAVLLPGQRDLAAWQIGSRELCTSFPHRDAMLLFAKADRGCS